MIPPTTNMTPTAIYLQKEKYAVLTENSTVKAHKTASTPIQTMTNSFPIQTEPIPIPLHMIHSVIR